MSSETDEWETPKGFFTKLDSEFIFTLDPCCTAENTKVRQNFFTEADNGLEQSWKGHTVFMNPPYSQCALWLEKACREAYTHNVTTVALIPSRTDTKYWHDYVMKAWEVRLVKGRLTFKNPNKPKQNPAPFPSAVVVFKKKVALLPPVFCSMDRV